LSVRRHPPDHGRLHRGRRPHYFRSSEKVTDGAIQRGGRNPGRPAPTTPPKSSTPATSPMASERTTR
jgi:hypothetical protein